MEVVSQDAMRFPEEPIVLYQTSFSGLKLSKHINYEQEPSRIKFRDSRTLGEKKEDLLTYQTEQFTPEWVINRYKHIDDPMKILDKLKFDCPAVYRVQKAIGNVKYHKDIRRLIYI